MLSRSSHTEVFLKKVFSKNLQNSQENTCTSFLSGTSNFIKEKTWAQCFPELLTVFPISCIKDAGQAKVHRMSIKRFTKTSL